MSSLIRAKFACLDVLGRKDSSNRSRLPRANLAFTGFGKEGSELCLGVNDDMLICTYKILVTSERPKAHAGGLLHKKKKKGKKRKQIMVDMLSTHHHFTVESGRKEKFEFRLAVCRNLAHAN